MNNKKKHVCITTKELQRLKDCKTSTEERKTIYEKTESCHNCLKTFKIFFGG